MSGSIEPGSLSLSRFWSLDVPILPTVKDIGQDGTAIRIIVFVQKH